MLFRSIIDCLAAIMRESPSNSRIASRPPPAAIAARSSLTSNASRASLRRANNEVPCRLWDRAKRLWTATVPVALSAFALSACVARAGEDARDPKQRSLSALCSTRAGGAGLNLVDALRPDPSTRPRRAGRVKSAASRRREHRHAQLALASEHGEHPPFDAAEHRGAPPCEVCPICGDHARIRDKAMQYVTVTPDVAEFSRLP